MLKSKRFVYAAIVIAVLILAFYIANKDHNNFPGFDIKQDTVSFGHAPMDLADFSLISRILKTAEIIDFIK